MATVVNTPQPAQTSNNGMGFFLGALILIIAAVIFFIYGIPYLQSAVRGPQVNVPSDINVNLNKQP
jgi:hypothetical protein